MFNRGAYTDSPGEHAELVERACDLSRSYAERSEEQGVYRHLLFVCGEPEALAKCKIRWNDQIPEEFRGMSLFDDADDVHDLFDVMQQRDGSGGYHHRDGALSFDDRGVVIGTDVVLGYNPREYTEAGFWDWLMGTKDYMKAVWSEVAHIKGNLGAGHAGVSACSTKPGVFVGVGVSEEANTVIPFVGGKIYRPGLLVPKRNVFVVESDLPDDLTPHETYATEMQRAVA